MNNLPCTSCNLLTIYGYVQLTYVSRNKSAPDVSYCGYTLVMLPRIVTLYRDCGRDSWPRNVSKVGYAVTCNATLHVHTCSGRKRIIPLIRRPNTDSTPNKPVTLPRYQCLLRYAVTTLHVHTCSDRNRIIPLIRRPNTDSTPNKPVTLPRNQLLIRYAVTSPVHTVAIRCYDTR